MMGKIEVILTERVLNPVGDFDQRRPVYVFTGFAGQTLHFPVNYFPLKMFRPAER